MTANVTVDRDKIIGAITELSVSAPLLILRPEQLKDCAETAVNVLIETTEDADIAERLALLGQIDHVDDAAEGLRKIAKLVRCGNESIARFVSG